MSTTVNASKCCHRKLPLRMKNSSELVRSMPDTSVLLCVVRVMQVRWLGVILVCYSLWVIFVGESVSSVFCGGARVRRVEPDDEIDSVGGVTEGARPCGLFAGSERDQSVIRGLSEENDQEARSQNSRNSAGYSTYRPRAR